MYGLEHFTDMTYGELSRWIKMPTDEEMRQHLYAEFESLDKLRETNKPDSKE